MVGNKLNPKVGIKYLFPSQYSIFQYSKRKNKEYLERSDKDKCKDTNNTEKK